MSATACPACGTPMAADALFCASCGAATPTGVMPSGAVAQSESEAPERGRLEAALGEQYELRGRIGSGGFAEVYEAFERPLKRRVAVKFLRADLIASAPLLERFRREAETVAQLRHPHIVPIYAVGEREGVIFYTMPLVSGESLRTRLDRETRLDIAEARRILLEVADALAEAHSAGLVHRDVKPENIMLEGAERRSLLMDFGIAKAALTPGASAALTGTGMALGTPHYMSPEQAAADARVDHRTDIYALGVVAFEMLSGRRPVDGDSMAEVMAHLFSAERPKLRSLRADVPESLAAAVERAIAPSPDDRFQSVESFRSSLEAPLVARPASAAAAARRRRVALAAVALLAVAATVTAVVVARRTVQHEWSTQPEPVAFGPWRIAAPFTPGLRLAPLGDTLLAVARAERRGILLYDGVSWRRAAANVSDVTWIASGEATWLLSPRNNGELWRLADSAVAAGAMPSRSSVQTAWAAGATLVIGTADGEIWRRLANEWRRDPTGSVRQALALWGRGSRLFALTLVPPDSLDDWILQFDGTAWRRSDPHPDPPGLTTFYEAGITLGADTTLLAANVCDSLRYRGSCRPLLLEQRGPDAPWSTVPVRMPASFQLFGLWARSRDRLFLWGRTGPADTGVLFVGEVRRGVLVPLDGLPGGRVIAMASLRGVPHILLDDGTLWAETGGQWAAVTRVPDQHMSGMTTVGGHVFAASQLPVGLISFDTALQVRSWHSQGGGRLARLDSGVAFVDTAEWSGRRHVRIVELVCDGSTGWCNNRAEIQVTDRRTIRDLAATADGTLIVVGDSGLAAELRRGRWSFARVPDWARAASFSELVPAPSGELLATSNAGFMVYSRGTWRPHSLRLVGGDHARGRQSVAALDSGRVAVASGGAVSFWRAASGSDGWQADYTIWTQGLSIRLHRLGDGRVVIGMGVPEDPMVGGSLMVVAPPYDSAHAARVPLPIRATPMFLADDGQRLYVWCAGWRLLTIPLDSLPLTARRAGNR